MGDIWPRKRSRLPSGEHGPRKQQRTHKPSDSRASTSRGTFSSSHEANETREEDINDGKSEPIRGASRAEERVERKSEISDSNQFGEGKGPSRTQPNKRNLSEYTKHASPDSDEEESSSNEDEGSDYVGPSRPPMQRKRPKSADGRPAPRRRTNPLVNASLGTADAKGMNYGEPEVLRPLRASRSLVNIHWSTDEDDENDAKDADFEPDTESEDEDRIHETQKKSPKLMEAAASLNATDENMAEFFRGLRISHYLQNPPPPLSGEEDSGGKASNSKKKKRQRDKKKSLQSPKKLYASTVTRAHLQEHGEWDFAPDVKRPGVTLPHSAEDIYRPIDLTGYGIPWSAKPFEDDDLTTGKKAGKPDEVMLKREARLDRGIRRGREWAEQCLTSKDLKPEFPIEWKLPEPPVVSRPEACRPEMPDSFKRHLERYAPVIDKSPSPCPSHDYSPQKPGHGQNAPPSRDEESKPKTDMEIPPQFLVAEQFIAKHGLKEGLVEDANRLHYFLIEEQRKFDEEIEKDLRQLRLYQSKLAFCARLDDESREGTQSFSFVPLADIEARDRKKHTGNAARTENADDLAETAMEINCKWVLFRGIDDKDMEQLDQESRQGKDKPGDRKPGKMQKSLSEIEVERKVGPLFVGLFKFSGLQEIGNVKLRYPKDLRLFGTSPRPDYAARASGREWAHWPVDLRPTVASGDFKRSDARLKDYEAQIALNSQFILKLGILMHLDTRKSATAPFPSWMWVYSWICTNQGFILYAHYPSLKLLDNGNDWSWKFVSFKVTDTFKDIWRYTETDLAGRLQAKAAFDMVASHTDFVLEQFRRWSQARGGYQDGGIMNQLIARAYLERGDEDWLSQALMTVKSKTL